MPQKDACKGETDCYICLEKCKEGPESVQLPCNHAFDRACITNWLKENDSCPVCRTKLNTERPEAQRRQPEMNQINFNNIFSFMDSSEF